MPPRAEAPLLLDTHVWVWLVDGLEDQLGSSAIRALQRASTEGRLLVSVLSVWEVAMLHARRRISLTLELDEWVRRALGEPGVSLADLTPEIAIESTRLPGTLHGDPMDRILVATARRTGAQLVTRDARLLEYSRAGHLAVIDATP